MQEFNANSADPDLELGWDGVADGTGDDRRQSFSDSGLCAGRAA
jgi:hypothetical protein